MGVSYILERLSSMPNDSRKAFIGLDGFVDKVLRVVDKRIDGNNCTYVKTLRDYGMRISEASGLSMNVEIVQLRKKLGGNGPIMANAAAALGLDVCCAGCFGINEIRPEFSELAAHAKLISLGDSAETDAYEFEDGKIITSSLSSLNALDWETVLKSMEKDRLCSILDDSDLISLNNWTMIPAMTDIWEKLQSDMLPALSPKKRLYFFDLADPFKRTEEDLKEALSVLCGFTHFGRTILSLNLREAGLIAKTLGVEAGDCQELCRKLCRAAGLEVIIHMLDGAVGCEEGSCIKVPGFYTAQPLLSVGGGDHFNAGLVYGIELGFSLPDAMLIANAVSGYYVRTGISPDREQLCAFLKQSKAI